MTGTEQFGLIVRHLAEYVLGQPEPTTVVFEQSEVMASVEDLGVAFTQLLPLQLRYGS